MNLKTEITFDKIVYKLRCISIDMALGTKRLFFPFYFHKNIKMVSPEKTISQITDYIKSEKSGAYLRFGDGEINVIEGKNEPEQDGDSTLKRELRESMEMSGDHIMKSLMLHSPRFGYTEGPHLVSDEWAVKLLKRAYYYFIGDKIYCHAAIAQCFEYKKKEMADLLKEIRKKQKKIFIGNKLVSKDILQEVFGENVIHIKVESRNCFRNVDTTEKELIEILEKNPKEFYTVIFAAGPTANVLQKRLYGKYNFFSVDFGSLIDAISGWSSRAWINSDKNYYMNILKELLG
jgi:hypothetical protein